MTPVDQEYVGEGKIGDCVRASTASILDLPLTSVPHFVMLYPDDAWYPVWEEFMRDHGLEPVMLHGPWEKPPKLTGYYLASGPCLRQGKHMVVMWNGELFHDPHPTKTGLTEIEAVWMLVKR